MPSASVSLRTRSVETVNGCADNLSTARPQDGRHLVGERCLPGCGPAVDRDTKRVRKGLGFEVRGDGVDDAGPSTRLAHPGQEQLSTTSIPGRVR